MEIPNSANFSAKRYYGRKGGLWAKDSPIIEVNLPKKIWFAISTAVRKVGGGHPWKTTAVDDRYIVLQVKRARYQSASIIAQQLRTATRRQVSRVTVARGFQKGGLSVCRLERCIPLKVGHQWHRLDW
ncbi:transposable element Tcb2 transposase [Trichonephila clavipes]|uniref:Transposable element Tcb2 transposase n=1 Tax=Trichonephila clavipes TaxID=2585209 RepID=A0A8X6VAD6_TRICX|nr:transposable element Tcb2 transposase [Trichonephila clavipes]